MRAPTALTKVLKLMEDGLLLNDAIERCGYKVDTFKSTMEREFPEWDWRTRKVRATRKQRLINNLIDIMDNPDAKDSDRLKAIRDLDIYWAKDYSDERQESGLSILKTLLEDR